MKTHHYRLVSSMLLRLLHLLCSGNAVKLRSCASISSQVCVQEQHAGKLTLAVVGGITQGNWQTQELGLFFLWKSHLFAICPHTTGKSTREGWDSSGTSSERLWSRSHKVL